MQTKKADIRNTILKVARQEFLTLGYKDTSMRKIASKAEVGLSNIYNYFRNKDEIFCKVLEPLLLAFDTIIEEHNNTDKINTEVFAHEDFQKKTIDEFMLIIKQYREELRLLLFRASGSSLEDYRDTFADKQTQKGVEYFLLMKEKYPETNTNISQFFIHTVSSWWLTVLGEIVTHDELTEEDTAKFMKEFISFGTAGWRKLMHL